MADPSQFRLSRQLNKLNPAYRKLEVIDEGNEETEVEIIPIFTQNQKKDVKIEETLLKEQHTSDSKKLKVELLVGIPETNSSLQNLRKPQITASNPVSIAQDKNLNGIGTNTKNFLKD